MAFDVTLKQSGKTGTLTLSGDLSQEIKQCRDLVVTAVGDGCTSIVLNVADLNYLSSTGLSFILQLRDALIAEDRNLVIQSPSDYILQLLSIMCMSGGGFLLPDENDPAWKETRAKAIEYFNVRWPAKE